MSRRSALGWFERIVRDSGSSTGFTEWLRETASLASRVFARTRLATSAWLAPSPARLPLARLLPALLPLPPLPPAPFPPAPLPPAPLSLAASRRFGTAGAGTPGRVEPELSTATGATSSGNGVTPRLRHGAGSG